jgi:hypothetical protein
LIWDWFYAVFKPPDAVDKADLLLMHDQFNGVKILLTCKAPGEIVICIDGGVKAAACRASKGNSVVYAASRQLEQGFDNTGYGNPVA